MLELKVYARAMRLPFLSASILPYIFGSLFMHNSFNWLTFSLGLCAVISGHIAGNLLNDYADSLTGVDELDTDFYGFFGGSKLIQHRVMSAATFLKMALVSIAICIISLICLVVYLDDYWLIAIILGALLLTASYSCKPLQLSYHGLGELVIAFIFGPVAVLGGAYLQHTPITDTLFNMSLVFGLLTAAILVTNEIPDAPQDSKAGKKTLVVRIGNYNAFVLYITLVIAAYMFIVIQYWMGGLDWFALLALLLLFIPAKSMFILQKSYNDKPRLTEASKLAITHQTIVGAILIFCAL